MKSSPQPLETFYPQLACDSNVEAALKIELGVRTADILTKMKAGRPLEADASIVSDLMDTLLQNDSIEVETFYGSGSDGCFPISLWAHGGITFVRDFIEDRGFDPDDDDSLREYVIEWRGYEEDFDEEQEGAIAGLKQDLDGLIDDRERDYWIEWDMKLREGTLPKAFHYLSELSLINAKSSNGLRLGQLDFIQGDRLGSNLTYVRAEDTATLACLQH